MWRDSYHPEPNWDDPQVWAYMVDRKMLWLNGPVRPIIGSTAPYTAVLTAECAARRLHDPEESECPVNGPTEPWPEHSSRHDRASPAAATERNEPKAA
jgi:hypothetical protein